MFYELSISCIYKFSKINSFSSIGQDKSKLFFSQAAVSIKISNLLICFCSFDQSCPMLEKDNFIDNLCIVLCCLIKYRSFLTLFVSI